MPSRLILRAAFVAAVLPCVGGCSTFAQVSGSGLVGGQRGETVAGGGVAGHVGLGGRIHPSGDPLAEESVLMPVGIDAMLRVNVTNRFTSLAYGGGYYLTADVGPHTAYGRALGLLECNVRDPVLCGGGARAELGFGLSLDSSDRTVPGAFVDESRRTKTLLTFGLFGEYTGYFTRPTELPMIGIEIGVAAEDDLIDVSRGKLLR